MKKQETTFTRYLPLTFLIGFGFFYYRAYGSPV